MIKVNNRLKFATCAAVLFLGSAVQAQLPEYEIISLGITGESNSGAEAIADAGQFAAGFSNADPIVWESGGSGSAVLPAQASRPFSMPRGVNDAGTIVGIGATTFFGSNALPIVWQNNSAAVLPLPSGESLGRAYAINNGDLAVGSVDGGSVEQAATFEVGGSGSVLTQTLNGGTLTTAYGINNGGRIVGQALDPENGAVTKGFYLDTGDTAANDIGALTGIGHNSAIAFDVSSNGLITGTSSLNGGANSRAFVWSEINGMTEVPLPSGTTSAGGRGVNADGWVVGTASSTEAVPYLYDGTDSYRLQDLITAGGAGWDVQSGTSNGAFSIADNGTIVGRGLLNGNLTAFAMVRVASDTDADGVNDTLDNCTLISNPMQRDTNGDGFGNACDPDLDNNGVVNFVDVSAWVPFFNSACGDGDEDFDGSGTCNFADFSLFAQFFLQPPGPSGLAP